MLITVRVKTHCESPRQMPVNILTFGITSPALFTFEFCSISNHKIVLICNPQGMLMLLCVLYKVVQCQHCVDGPQQYGVDVEKEGDVQIAALFWQSDSFLNTT